MITITINLYYLLAVVTSIVAAAASVLLCYGLHTALPFGMLLLILSPMPLIIAGLSYHSLAAALAALLGCLFLTLIPNTPLTIVYALLVGIPAIFISYMALRQPRYSIGVILLGIAGCVSLITVTTLVMAIPNFANLSPYLTQKMQASFKLQSLAERSMFETLDIKLLVRAVPIMSAVSFFMMFTLSGYLGAKITSVSGKLECVWPDFHTLKLPLYTLGIFGGAVGLIFSPHYLDISGYFGLVGEILTTTILLCFMLQGLSVLHYKLKKPSTMRWLLPLIWGSIIILGFVGLAFSVLGIADLIFDFRKPRIVEPLPPNPFIF